MKTSFPKFLQSGNEYYSGDDFNLIGCGNGAGEGNGDAGSSGNGYNSGYGDGLGGVGGGGFGDGGVADGDYRGDGKAYGHVIDEEEEQLFLPWTPETILHAYAYLNATSQEEKDSILGLVELREH